MGTVSCHHLATPTRGRTGNEVSLLRRFWRTVTRLFHRETRQPDFEWHYRTGGTMVALSGSGVSIGPAPHLGKDGIERCIHCGAACANSAGHILREGRAVLVDELRGRDG